MSEFDPTFLRKQAAQATYADALNGRQEEHRQIIFQALDAGAIVTEGVVADNFAAWEQSAAFDGLASHVIERKTQLLAAYQPYASDTRRLISELPPHEPADDSWPGHKIHPEHITDGFNANVFLHRFPLGEAIIRLYTFEGITSYDIMEDGDTNAQQVDTTISSLIKVEGKPRFERAIAASYLDGTVISKPVLGCETGPGFTKDTLASVNDEHLHDLRATLHPTLTGELWVPSSSKVMFDKNEGFTLLSPWWQPSPVGAADLNAWSDIFSEYGGSEEPIDVLERRLTVLNRFARICQETYQHYDQVHHTSHWPTLQQVFAKGRRFLHINIEWRNRPADS